mgnify:CR=1 FL=1
MRKILLAGSNGQIGWELHRCLAPLGKVIAPNHQQMDLTNPNAIRATIREIAPAIIVNAAAYTAVDQAESQPDLAMAVNGIAPGIMAEEAKKLGAVMVHYSTDYVFDGCASVPYREDDRPNPLSVYGNSKLAGEQAIQTAGACHLIFRTSWVYAARGKNFLLTILRLARERDELEIVADQVGAPTWGRTIASATATILGQPLARLAADAPATASLLPWFEQVSGIYHLTASGQTSWHGFAERILQEVAPPSDSAPTSAWPKLVSITTADFPLPARRPAYSVMSNAKLFETFGIALPEWEKSLRLCVQELPGERQ